MTLTTAPRTMKMVPYDYFAPWVKVTLYSPDGGEFPLWQGTGYIEDGSAAKVKFEGTNLAVLQEVLIEWQGMYYQTTINLSPNYDDAIKIVDSYLLQQGKTEVKVEMGFRTGTEGPVLQQFNGVIEEVDFSIGTEITLTLKTVPPPMVTKKASRSDKDNKTNPWNNKSAFDIIKLLWESNTKGPFKYKVEVGPEDAAIEKLKTPRDSYDRGDKSDWTVIMALIEDCHCLVLVDGPTLKITSKLHSIGVQESVATFRLFSGGTMGGSTNDYPILAASLKTPALFARSATGFRTQGTDEDTGKAVTQTVGTPGADNSGEKVGAHTPPAAGAPGGSPTPETSTVPEGGAKGTQVQDPKKETEKDEKLRIAIDKWKFQGIQLEIETLLIPHLVPHQVIDVVGMGGRIDGKYWIEKLFFQVGPDGGLTRFDCVRTAPRKEEGQQPPLPGKVNANPQAQAEGASSEVPAQPEG